jgi:dipeptidase E
MDRRPAYHRLLIEGKIQGGYAADDGVALHFMEDKLYAIVSSRPKARGYDVYIKDQKVVENPLPTFFLG